MQLLYVQRVILCSVNDIQNDGTASVNPAFTEAWDRGACKPPSVAIRSLHNVINRYLAVTRPMEVESLSGGNIDIITFLARHSEREIFPQDVERRFGITRSTSSRVLALMERKGLIVRESVPRDARLKKIVLTDKSRDIAEALRANAVAMEGILLQGLSDDEIREFMHVLDVMQTNLVSTGLIGDESRYSSLALCEAESPGTAIAGMRIATNCTENITGRRNRKGRVSERNKRDNGCGAIAAKTKAASRTHAWQIAA